MRTTYIIIISLFAVLQLPAQSRVSVQPSQPQRGQTVIITYDPTTTGATIPATATSITLVFSYSNLYELPYRIALQKKGNLWQTSFVAPRYATYATFYLQSGELIDKPAADKHYELAIYENNQRVMSGYLYEAYSLQAQMGKAPSLVARQLALFEKELSFYPDNYEAKVRSLNAKMIQSTGATKEEYRSQAHAVIAAKFKEAPGKMAVLNKVTMAYLIIGENSRLDSIRQVVRTQYPRSEVAYELLTAEIGKEKDPTVKMARLQKALQEKTPDNAAYFSDMHEELFELYAGKKDVKNALYHLQQIGRTENPYLPLALKKFAKVLSDNNIALDTAMVYAQQALQRAPQFPVGLIRFFPETGYIPGYVDDSTRQAAIRTAKGNMLSLIAQIQWKQGKTTAAHQSMEEAVTVSKDPETLTNAAAFYTQTGKPAKAFEAYYTILVNAPEDTSSMKALKQTYIAWQGSEKGFEQKVTALQTIWRERILATLKKERINTKAPSLEQFLDLTGKPISPATINNKIVVIDFWATWCVPCMKEMPYLQAVYNKYKDHPQVSFLVINSGARNTLTDAQNWSGNKTYSFPVYYNPDPAIGDKFGFNVIPATYVINPAGNIQFKTIGFEGPAIEQKLSAAIELLLSETAP